MTDSTNSVQDLLTEPANYTVQDLTETCDSFDWLSQISCPLFGLPVIPGLCWLWTESAHTKSWIELVEFAKSVQSQLDKDCIIY